MFGGTFPALRKWENKKMNISKYIIYSKYSHFTYRLAQEKNVECSIYEWNGELNAFQFMHILMQSNGATDWINVNCDP